MLTIVKETATKSPIEIEHEHPNCKYLFIDFTDLNNLRGHLYAISEDIDSFESLCELSDQLTNEGITCCIMGDYI